MGNYKRLLCTHQGEPIKIIYIDMGGNPIIILRKRYIDPALDMMLENSGTYCEGGIFPIEEIRAEVENRLNGGRWDVEILCTDVLLPRTIDRDAAANILSKL